MRSRTSDLTATGVDDELMEEGTPTWRPILKHRDGGTRQRVGNRFRGSHFGSEVGYDDRRARRTRAYIHVRVVF